MDMDAVTCTAAYFNPNKQQWECWAVNQATQHKIFLGCCDAIAPKEYRDKWELDLWADSMQEITDINGRFSQNK